MNHKLLYIRYREAARDWTELIKRVLLILEEEERARVKEIKRTYPIQSLEPLPYTLQDINIKLPEYKLKELLFSIIKPHIWPLRTHLFTLQRASAHVRLSREVASLQTPLMQIVSETKIGRFAITVIAMHRVEEARILGRELLEDLALLSEIGEGRTLTSILEVALKLEPSISLGVSSMTSWEGTMLILYSGCDRRSWIEYSLALIALELYRSLTANPKHLDPMIITDEKDLTLLQYRDEGVFVFTCEYLRNLSENKGERGLRYLREQLLKLVGYGFKIVIMPIELATQLEELKELRDQRIPGLSWISRISARALTLSEYNSEKLCLLSSIITGFLEDPRRCSVSREIGGSLEGSLAFSRNNLARLLDEPLSVVLSRWPWKLRASVGDAESYNHLALKAFAILHLINNMGVSPNDVLVEDEIEKEEKGICSGLVPDVYVKSKGIVIDVKSGTGRLPLMDVREAFEKYVDSCRSAREVWIVIRPFTFVLYTKPLLLTLRKLRERLREQYRDIDVSLKLMIPAYVNNRYVLLDSSEFLKRIKELLARKE